MGSNKDLSSDFRLIAATNQPLSQSLKKKKLREDFYHRIAHCIIEIPPLRDRLEDIPRLANMFADRLISRERLQVQGLDSAAMSKLQRYAWPGNIRELQSVVEGGVYRAQFHGRRYVELADLQLQTKGAKKSDSSRSFRRQVEQFEAQLVQDALRRSDGNQSKAADLLGLDRTSLRRILERGKRS